MGQTKKAPAERPSQFEVGDLIFFDFGPPFQYYNLFVVRPTETGTEITRFIFSRPGDKCFTPVKLEMSTSVVKQSVAELLGAKNPCGIPENQLKKEAKRCKHCLVFSGSDVIMRVTCGGQRRLIRADILDRDMFDPNAKTPENTAWTMTLMEQLNKPVGPGVMEKPMFQVNESPAQEVTQSKREADLLAEIESGEFDALFPVGPGSEKLSLMVKGTHDFRPKPWSAKLKSSTPFAPQNFMEVGYPPLALQTRTEGEVSLAFEVSLDGSTGNARILSGHKLLNQAALSAAAGWKFPTSASGQTIQATIKFAINCPQ